MAKIVNERKMFGRASRAVAWAVCALSIAALATTAALQVTGKPEKKPRIWCTGYDPLSEKLMVYAENKGKTEKGSELGVSLALSPSSYFGNTRALAYVCREDGTIWLIDANSIYKGEIVFTGEQNPVINLIQKSQYSSLPEFKGEGVVSIAAGMWWPVNESRPYAAVVTNTGFFEAFQPPLEGPTITEKSVVDLRSEYADDDRAKWPGIMQKAVVGALSAREFSVIPLAKDQSEMTTVLYYILFRDSPPYDGKGGAGLISMDAREKIPDLKTILEAEAIVYDIERGDWVTALKGIISSGRAVQLDISVKPREVLEDSRGK